MVDIDQVRLNMSAESIGSLKYILALIMYGVALELKIDDFKIILKNPKGIIAGLVGQFITLPLVTFILLNFIDIKPSIALGIILVSACPGGNLSNFMSYLAKGNVALSVGLTAVSTILAIVMTPFNLLLYGRNLASTAPILKEISIDRVEMFEHVFIMLGIPLILGMLTRHYKESFALKVENWIKKFSMAFLFVFIIGALYANWNYFVNYIGMIMWVVLLHNIVTLLGGYLTAKLFRCDARDTRSIIIEIGIQNSGLGLALVFQFFQGLGGMAIVSAWWGVCHMISGISLVQMWKIIDRRKELKKAFV